MQTTKKKQEAAAKKAEEQAVDKAAADKVAADKVAADKAAADKAAADKAAADKAAADKAAADKAAEEKVAEEAQEQEKKPEIESTDKGDDLLDFKGICEDLKKNQGITIQSHGEKEATVSFYLKNNKDQGKYTITQGADQNITFKPQITWEFNKESKLSDEDQAVVDRMSEDALKYRSVFTTIKGPKGTDQEKEQQVKALSESLLAAAAKIKKDITLNNLQYTYDELSEAMVVRETPEPTPNPEPEPRRSRQKIH